MNTCLIVHGVTGTPQTVAPLAEAMRENGYFVDSPCLSGHGQSLERLEASRWEEWYDGVRQSYKVLREKSDRIFYTGISLGALLGLKLAIDEGKNLSGLALLATPLEISWCNRLLTAMVRYTPMRAVVRSVAKNFEQSVADPEGRRLYRQYSLPRLPAHSVFELSDLQQELLPNLHRIVCPTLIVHALQDNVAPYSNVALLQKELRSTQPEVVTLTRSRHVITLDYEKDVVAKAVLQFFCHTA
ncbi:MAG: alpha/beta fold hydrolase [Deltaproteobacteria bacterium]|nr:alpha/beta fold hydrolase [Deltaproteobacteria bacterium]